MHLKKKKNKDSAICCLQESYFKYKDTHRLKVKGWIKICHANMNQKKANIAILISGKACFTARKKYHR